MEAIFISQFLPDPEGHGGNHRTYQIFHDLEAVFGRGRVHSLHYWSVIGEDIASPGKEAAKSIRIGKATQRAYSRIGHGIARRVRRAATSTAAMAFGHEVRRRVAAWRLGERIFSDHQREALLRNVRHVAEAASGPLICFVEHPAFAEVLTVDSPLGLPTVACPANLESLDLVAACARESPTSLWAGLSVFAREFQALESCEARLMISRVEAGLLSGLGLPSLVYPYVPVGSVRERLLSIRQARAVDRPVSATYLLLGSAAHETTHVSFSWFLRNLPRLHPPDRTRVLVVGAGTEMLGTTVNAPSSVEFLGRVSTDHLFRLMSGVDGAFVPQTCGFGAVTRIAEYACAGIPTLVSRHAAQAVDLPPGITVVDDTWEAWRRAILQPGLWSHTGSLSDYERWERNGIESLRAAVASLACHVGTRRRAES